MIEERLTEKRISGIWCVNPSKGNGHLDGKPRAHVNQQQMDDCQTGLISTPRTPPPHDMKPRKGCLRVAAAPHATLVSIRQVGSSKNTSFAAYGTRCLITNTAYESHSQDGKAWRHQEAVRMREEKLRQAALLPGDHGQQQQPLGPPPYAGADADRWADRGWESAGLGEDTPMGGMSEEMDTQAARWRELDIWLEEQLALAERNRAEIEAEVRSARSIGWVDGGWCRPPTVLGPVLS